MKRCGLLLALGLLLVDAAAAQFGAVGISAVGMQRFDNEDLLFFEPQVGDHFAWSFASGDFNGDGADDLATGVPHDNGIAGFETLACGAVAVRYGVPGSGLASGLATTFLNQFAGGSPDPPEAGDRFGYALAACDFNGDGFDDLAVGVPGESVAGASRAGAVEVYFGAASGLPSVPGQFFSQATLGIPGDAETGDELGYSLACGDFDGDFFPDLAAGAPFETIESIFGDDERAGAIEVIYGSPSGLDTATADALDENESGGVSDCDDFFGFALAVGNFDHDGQADLAIGAPGVALNTCGFDVGSGLVFVLFGGSSGLYDSMTFVSEPALGGASEAGDHFGYALAAGDFDGDAFDDLAIGSPFEDFGGTSIPNAGQVATIQGGFGGLDFARTRLWYEDIIHGLGATEASDLFGSALATGDFDRDGFDDLAIGGPGEFVLVPQDGLVTVVMGSVAGISAARRHGLAAGFYGDPLPQNQANRNYGYALATGDFDGDGYADLVIGAPNEDTNGIADVGAEVVMYGSLFSDGFEVQNAGFWSAIVP